MKLFSVMLIILAMISGFAMANSGVVIAVDKTDPTLISVRSDTGQQPAMLRLMDISSPSGARAGKAADDICRLICSNLIEWDVIDSGVNGVPEVYVYMGKTWINDALIRHGMVQSVAHPHHPDLLNSEREAKLVSVGIWRGNIQRQIGSDAVVVDGARGMNGQGVAFPDVLVKSN